MTQPTPMTQPTARLTRRALAIGLAAAPLAACGIKGPNRRPPDADPAYPRAYPPPDSMVPSDGRDPETADSPDGQQDGR